MNLCMISVIMPVYNGEKYITQAIDSVLSQTYPNWELIIINDGSTDDTAKIIKSKYNQNKIKYIYQENQGPSIARNRGIDLAQGDYIAFIDADDLYTRDKLEKQLQFLEEHSDYDIVYNDIKVVDDSLCYINTLKSEGVFANPNDFLANLLFRQIIPSPQSILAKRKCFENGLRYNPKYLHSEDYELTIRLAHSFHYGYLPETLYIYRRHGKNLTNEHERQLLAEKRIVKNLGYTKIEQIVEASTLPIEEKQLLLAKIFIKIEEYERAKKVLDSISDTNNSLIFFYLGNCCYFLNELDNCIVYYKKAIERNGNMAEAFNNLGCVYAIKGDMKKASLFFMNAMEINESYIDANYNIEQLICKMPKWKLTTRELRKTLTPYQALGGSK